MLPADSDAARPTPLTRPAITIPGVAAVEIVRDALAVEGAWRAFEAGATGHVFQEFAFVSTWLRTVGRERGVQPLVVIGRDGVGQILFILPFGVTRRLGRRVIEWLGAEHADYHCGLYDPGFLARAGRSDFAQRVMALLKGEADLCNFSRQPVAIDGLPNPFAAYRPLKQSDRSHETRLAASWDEYYRAKRNSSSRRHDRSKLKRLEELGEVTVNTDPSPPRIERAMSVLFHYKERSLGQLGAGGFFCSEGVTEFYRELARVPYPAGPCQVATVEVGGDIVAVNWGLVRRNRYYYVMHAYAADGLAAKSSPGRLLMYGLMQWCIGRGIDTFDFTIGDEGFKEQWCESTLPLGDSVAALNGSGAAVAFALRSAKAAKRFIKTRPALRGVAEELRRRLPFPRPRSAPPVAG